MPSAPCNPEENSLKCDNNSIYVVETDIQNAFSPFLPSFSRQQLSKATVDTPPISPSTPASAVKCRTPRRSGQKCNSSVLTHFFQKRSKTPPTEDTVQDGCVSQRVQRGRRQPACSRNANEGDLHSAPPQLPVVVKEEPTDEEAAFVTASVKQEDTGSSSVSTGDAAGAPSSSLSVDVKPIIKGKTLLPVRRGRARRPFLTSSSMMFSYQMLHIKCCFGQSAECTLRNHDNQSQAPVPQQDVVGPHTWPQNAPDPNLPC